MARPSTLKEEQLNEIKEHAPFTMADKWQIAEKYGISDTSAYRIVKKLGLIQTSSSNIEMIVRYKNGERMTDLTQEYGMSQVNFHALLRKRNIAHRDGNTYSADFHYFDVIDTEDKAYFLGFIYADGCVYIKDRNLMAISIRDYDVDVLEKLNHYMKSNYPIHNKMGTGFESESPMVLIQMANKDLVAGLKKHGVVPNKTHLIERIPDIPEDLIRHFIRGYIDGDGSFGCYLKKDGYYRYAVSIVGTDYFLEDIRSYCNIFSPSLVQQDLQIRWKERDNNTRNLRLSGKQNVLSFLDWLYQDATVYLERKYQKYMELLR